MAVVKSFGGAGARAASASRSRSGTSSPRGFAKRWRLLKRSEYLVVQNRGTRVVTRHFVILLYNSPLTHPRIGVTVSKKVGNAVVRNRVRRRVKEVFRQNKAWFPDGQDIVIIAKKRAAEATLEEIWQDLERAKRPMAQACSSAR